MPKTETLPPVIAIVGADVFLQLEAIGDVLRRLPGDADRVDVDGDTARLADTLDELRSLSMFGGYKLVVVRGADDFVSKFREQLEDYLDAPGDAGTLVLRVASMPKNTRIFKAIDKRGGIVGCEPPRQGDLAPWIVARGRAAHQVKVNDDAARVLADLIGPDLGRLDNELAKLSLQVEGGVLRADDISSSVAFQREQAMWDLTDALTLGQSDEAVRRWRHLVVSDPSSEFRAVTWLGLWLEKAGRALSMKRMRMNAFAISKELKIWPASNAEKLLVTVERLGERRIADAVERLIDVDRKNKSGLGDPTANVEQFLLTMSV